MATPPGLAFSELKITGDEFLVLNNNGTAALPDLSQYWLEDFNNTNPLAGGVSNSSQQLPAVSLEAGQSLLLSSAARDTCGAEVAGKLSLSLTDSGGFLEIVQMNQSAGGAVSQVPGDAVSWSSGSNGQIPNVPSSTKDPQAVYYRSATGSNYVWQVADLQAGNGCQLTVASGSGTTLTRQTVSVGDQPATGDSAPVTISDTPQPGVDTAASSTDSLAVNLGLQVPEITEILPNPVGSGNDASDEYIELYNPNDRDFALDSFILQTGTTVLHKFTFSAGTALAAKSFAAFYSADTGLSLSNSGGQVKLLDPAGTVVATTDSYGTAKDGQAWALAHGSWVWTTSPTPGAPNVIMQPVTAASKKPAAKIVTSRSKSGSSVKAASTAKRPKTTKLAASSTATTQPSTTPIHPWVLALVAGLAVLYGAYEYRSDFANRIHQFRANRAARRAAGP